MRSILAGLFILLLSATCFAQTKGEVESIGYAGYFRPDCWTPMVIRLRPGTLDPGTYQIQVEQKDLDEDTQVFTRTITVNAADQSREQRFWMYFLPQPQEGGLPDSAAGASTTELNRAMKVWLCTDTGKQIEPLPITSGVRSIDASNGRPLGRKFILCVTDGSSKPIFGDYNFAFGITEDVAMITVRPDELPESVLGLDGVDAVVWMSGDAAQLSAAGSHRLQALTEYIHLGGKLIVTQPAERSKIESLDTLLPIKLKDANGNWLLEERERTTLAPLRDWVKPKMQSGDRNPWLHPRGTFKVAHDTEVQPGAIVSETINWNDDQPGAAPDTSPFLVRWGVGLGEVVWVAQDLGDITITSQIQSGWMGVWDKVLDIKNDPKLILKNTSYDDETQIKTNYGEGLAVDLGASLPDAMEHNARGATLVIVAIVFFIVYWVLSGPVSYFVLANKKRKGMSWQIFAASAIVATLLTVGVVKLVLGGGADIHHISFVRLAPGQPAEVESKIGVYLTKSSNIPITLDQTDPAYISYVSAFAPHPQSPSYHGAGGFVGKERYSVAIPESGSADTIEISVPFRSTLKKLQARWLGTLPSVDGFPKLVEASEESPLPVLTGKLTNSTGRDLTDVYFAFKSRSTYGEGFDDRLFYLPKWPKDGQIDLDKDITAYKVSVPVKYAGIDNKGAKPGDGKVIGDVIRASDDGWSAFWADPIRHNSTAGIDESSDRDYVRSFPMISLFERLAVVKKADPNAAGRYDLQHRGVRKLDMSQSMAGGELVILAQDAANDVNGERLSPLPYPLEVDHDKIAGTGVTFYQITLPLTRIEPTPTTQPATLPTTRAVEK